MEKSKYKKQYSITPSGREYFNAWVNTPMKGGQSKNPDLPKLYFMGLSEKETRIDRIEKHIASIEEVYNMLNAIYQDGKLIKIDEEHQDILTYQVLSLKYGVDALDFEIEWYRKLIADIMGELSYNTEEKKIDNIPIYYYVSGNPYGECIIFVHAAFADHTSFDKQVAYFAEKYKVITLDLVGHGKSINTQKGDSIDKTADYIYKIMHAEGVEKLHLVGVSIGAVLIQDFANKYPDNVNSLCCIGGYDINNFDTSMQKENSGEQMKMMLKAVFSIKWFAESNKLISAATPEAQEEFYKMNIKFKKSSFRYLATLSKLVNQFKTKERNYPLMIACGDKDIPMEIKVAKMWHEIEPKSKLIIFENAGHLVNMDVPNKFNTALDEMIFSQLQA